MIKPGDIIEWVYKITNNLVIENETLWSSVTESWCQIGSGLTHTCIACDGLTITWLNSNGLFRARMDDAWDSFSHEERLATVVPRVKK